MLFESVPAGSKRPFLFEKGNDFSLGPRSFSAAVGVKRVEQWKREHDITDAVNFGNEL